MTVEGMTAAEKGTMTAFLPEETRTAIATTADEDAVGATVAAVAEAGAKTGFETERGTEIGTETAHEAGPTAEVVPGAEVEREIRERVAQKVVMFMHLLQLYPQLRQSSPSRL